MAAPGVVVTRDESEDGPLGRLLRERGLRVQHWPTIHVAPPADPAPLLEALAGLGSFDWVAFTSPRAVAAVTERLPPVSAGSHPAGGDPPHRVRVAAVGEATAGSLRDAGWPVDLVPAVFTGEALLAALVEAGVGSGTRVFFPASAIARDTLPDGLIEAGAVVVQVEAYRMEAPPLDRAMCRAALESGAVELVTFTSPSTVDNLTAALGPELAKLARARLRAVAIGPTTGAAAERAGYDVVVADPHTLDGLAEGAARAASPNRGGTR